VGSRRRKHWGWGYEDEQLDAAQVREAAAFLAAHLGFGSTTPDVPVALQACALPPPRLTVPAALASICATDQHTRACHSHGSSYRDVVRAFRGRFDHVPDVVAAPRDEPELSAVLDWALGAGAAVIPFGGGTSVVGGVEPDVPDRFAGGPAGTSRRSTPTSTTSSSRSGRSPPQECGSRAGCPGPAPGSRPTAC
jgi:alkyldihydroxyacetonephosphate synthase